MIKSVKFSFFIILLALNPLRAQLAADIDMIRQEHDLMGGVVTLYCSGQMAEQIPFGWADYGRQIPATDSTLYRIASISKTVTAMAFMKLHDEGLVDLDADISAILGYSVVNPYHPGMVITPRMLLSHTSSLIEGSTYPQFLSDTYYQIPMPGLDELLTPSGSYYTTDQFNTVMPGTYFNYSNLNFVVIGTLIEKISGQRFDEFCRNTFFLPMGISGSFNVNHIANLDNLAVLYRKINGNWAPQADNYLGIQPEFPNIVGYIPGTNGARFAPQGGLRCSGADLSKIMRLLLNQGEYNGTAFLTPQAVGMMLANEWTFNGSNGNNYYGLFRSWGLGIHRILNIPNADVVLTGSDAMFGHPGEAYGLVSDAYIDTTRMLGLVFMTNGCGAGYQVSGESAFYTVEKQVFEALDPYADALICYTTGLDKKANNENRSAIFYDPVSERLKIEVKNVSNPTIYRIFNMTGIKIVEGTLRQAVSSIDAENFPPGIYLLQIDSNPSASFKFIK